MTDDFKESDVKRDKEGQFARVAALPTFGRPGGPKRNHAPGTKAGIAEYRRMAKDKIQKIKRESREETLERRAADDIGKTDLVANPYDPTDPAAVRQLRAVLLEVKRALADAGIEPPPQGTQGYEKSPDLVPAKDKRSSIKGKRRRGSFVASTGGGRRPIIRINLEDNDSRQHVATLLHELGHHIDYRHGANMSMAKDADTATDGGESPAFRAFIRYLRLSDPRTKMWTERADGGSSWDKYIVKATELWARAFQQYVGYPSDPYMRWSDEEAFDRDIRPLVEDILREAGWLAGPPTRPDGEIDPWDILPAGGREPTRQEVSDAGDFTLEVDGQSIKVDLFDLWRYEGDLYYLASSEMTFSSDYDISAANVSLKEAK